MMLEGCEIRPSALATGIHAITDLVASLTLLVYLAIGTPSMQSRTDNGPHQRHACMSHEA